MPVTDAELNARFETLQTTLEASIKAEGLVTRRHFDIVTDGLRADIRIITEGHDVQRERTDELKAGLARVEAGQGRLEIRQLGLEHRQGRLEEPQETLEEHQKELADAHRALTTEVRLLAARLCV
jgi:hypothetical protein